MRADIYCRVSSDTQTVYNQLLVGLELDRRFTLDWRDRRQHSTVARALSRAVQFVPLE